LRQSLMKSSFEFPAPASRRMELRLIDISVQARAISTACSSVRMGSRLTVTTPVPPFAKSSSALSRVFFEVPAVLQLSFFDQFHSSWYLTASATRFACSSSGGGGFRRMAWRFCCSLA
jgi:hypothetical protein